MHAVAIFLSAAVNPVLLLLVILAPLVGGGRSRWRFWLVSALSVGLAVGLAEAGKALRVWPGNPEFPSGHETFAAAAATRLAACSPRWLPVGIPLCGLIGWGLVAAGFHEPSEIFAGALLGTTTALAGEALSRRLEGRRQDLRGGTEG